MPAQLQARLLAYRGLKHACHGMHGRFSKRLARCRASFLVDVEDAYHTDCFSYQLLRVAFPEEVLLLFSF